MAVSAPQSTPMERRASRPYINNHSAPPYTNREEATRHQSATIKHIEQQQDSCYIDSSRWSNTTGDANEPSRQLTEPEDSTFPGQVGTETSSPVEPCRKMAAALTLLQFSQGAVVFGQDGAQPATAQPESIHRSPATQPPVDEALAPDDLTQDELEISQQEQGQQEPREFKKTGEDDGHTDCSASAVSENWGSGRPLPNCKPQSVGKRKRVKEEEQKKETEKESKTKKTAKAKGSEPKAEKAYQLWCHCGEAFMRNDHLMRHERNVHGIEMEAGVRGFEKFQCDLCSRRFGRKDNLKSHRNTQHLGAGPAPVPKSVFVDKDDNIIPGAPVRRPRSSQQTARREPISGSSSPLEQEQEGGQIQKVNNNK